MAAVDHMNNCVVSVNNYNPTLGWKWFIIEIFHYITIIVSINGPFVDCKIQSSECMDGYEQICLSYNPLRTGASLLAWFNCNPDIEKL